MAGLVGTKVGVARHDGNQIAPTVGESRKAGEKPPLKDRTGYAAATQVRSTEVFAEAARKKTESPNSRQSAREKRLAAFGQASGLGTRPKAEPVPGPRVAQSAQPKPAPARSATGSLASLRGTAAGLRAGGGDDDDVHSDVSKSVKNMQWSQLRALHGEVRQELAKSSGRDQDLNLIEAAIHDAVKAKAPGELKKSIQAALAVAEQEPWMAQSVFDGALADARITLECTGHADSGSSVAQMHLVMASVSELLAEGSTSEGAVARLFGKLQPQVRLAAELRQAAVEADHPFADMKAVWSKAMDTAKEVLVSQGHSQPTPQARLQLVAATLAELHDAGDVSEDAVEKFIGHLDPQEQAAIASGTAFQGARAPVGDAAKLLMNKARAHVLRNMEREFEALGDAALHIARNDLAKDPGSFADALVRAAKAAQDYRVQCATWGASVASQIGVRGEELGLALRDALVGRAFDKPTNHVLYDHKAYLQLKAAVATLDTTSTGDEARHLLTSKWEAFAPTRDPVLNGATAAGFGKHPEGVHVWAKGAMVSMDYRTFKDALVSSANVAPTQAQMTAAADRYNRWDRRQDVGNATTKALIGGSRLGMELAGSPMWSKNPSLAASRESILSANGTDLKMLDVHLVNRIEMLLKAIAEKAPGAAAGQAGDMAAIKGLLGEMKGYIEGQLVRIQKGIQEMKDVAAANPHKSAIGNDARKMQKGLEELLAKLQDPGSLLKRLASFAEATMETPRVAACAILSE